MSRTISRKKALELMSKTYNAKHPEYLPRLIDNAIRGTLGRRRTSNDYDPKIADVLTDEIRDLLRNL